MAIPIFNTDLTDFTRLEAIFWRVEPARMLWRRFAIDALVFWRTIALAGGVCQGHNDNSALAFVCVNYLPLFFGSCQISPASTATNRFFHPDFFDKSRSRI